MHAAKPPDPDPRRPGFEVPAGAVDTHLHLFGPAARYPFAPDSVYTTPDALPESCIAMHDAIGIACGVIVSGGAYGRDYRHLLDALAAHPTRFRGVVLPPDDLAEAEIARMHALGVRGVRFFSEARPKHLPRILPGLAAKIAALGWHALFYASGTDLAEHADRLLALPVPVVVDHFGAMPAELGVEQPAFRALLRMLESGRVWVKLSGPMYGSKLEFPYADILPFARTLVKHAPERLLWGSDWPHLHMHERAMPNDGALMDLMGEWVPDRAIRDRILRDHPRKLYGLDAGA